MSETWTPLLLDERAYQRVLDVNAKLLAANNALTARIAELEAQLADVANLALLRWTALREIDDVPYGNDGAIAAHRIARAALEPKGGGR